MKIAVIGGGPGGFISAIVASRRLKGARCPVTIDIFEANAPFRGRSFDTYSQSMLLNTGVVISSVDPSDPEGFLNYLAQEEGISSEPGEVVPRDSARRYLRYEYERAAAGATNFHMISELIEDISPFDQDKLVVRSSHTSRTYDAIILATGLRFKEAPEAFRGRTVLSPYPATRLDGIDPEAPVLVLGSHLSAIDVLAHLSASGHQGAIHVHSRSGLFPSVRRRVAKSPEQLLLQKFLLHAQSAPPDQSRISILLDLIDRHLQTVGMRLSDFAAEAGTSGHAQLNREISLCESGNNAWEPVLMDIIDALNFIWPTLPADEKRHFRSEIGPWLSRLLCAMPLQNALIVQKLMERGQLRIVSADEIAESGLDAYGAIVNATGMQSANDDPLLAHLADEGILRFNDGGGVTIDAVTHRVSCGLPIYANGAIVQGEVFTANSIYSSAHGAERIAQDLLRVAAESERTDCMSVLEAA